MAMVVYKRDVKVPPAPPSMGMPASYAPVPMIPMMSLAGPPQMVPPSAGTGTFPMIPGMPPIPMMPATLPPPTLAPGPAGLPAGLDLSAISALAAAFGVAPQPPGPQQ